VCFPSFFLLIVHFLSFCTSNSDTGR